MPGFFRSAPDTWSWAFTWTEGTLGVIGHSVDGVNALLHGSLSEDSDLKALVLGMSGMLYPSRECSKEELLRLLAVAMNAFLKEPQSTSLESLLGGCEGLDLIVSARQNSGDSLVLEGDLDRFPTELVQFLTSAFEGTGVVLTLKLVVEEGYDFGPREIADFSWELAIEAIVHLLRGF